LSEERSLKPLIGKVAAGESLSVDETTEAFDIMMSGEATPAQIGGFLMALRVRGETVDEITGGATVMRAKALPIKAPVGAIDVVGTGGDQSGSYNVSTATALVVAGAGVPVAKHGNRAMSSKCGSADVLQALGVNIECDVSLVQKSLDEAGICFMLAPTHHSAMRHVGPTRVELGTRTMFNLLGPLSNPAGVKRFLLGVFAREWMEPMAQVLKQLGAERAWVVHGSDGLDEMTTTGATYVCELKDGEISSFEVNPRDIGIQIAQPQTLKGGDAVTNAGALGSVLAAQSGPFRNITLFNAAAALVVAGKADDLKAGAMMAVESIDGGGAQNALAGLVEITNEDVA
jgi:anthranilate phosphoribosyltransferase